MRLADVGAEAAFIVGGGRAILLQIADPAIGHAVARHSDFVADPLRRLRNTLTFVYALQFGTPRQVAAVTAMVNGAHGPVRSRPGEQLEYDARNGPSQLWVAATLYDTAMAVHDRVLPPLTDDDRDAIYADYAVVGTALQMPAAQWPADRAAFGAYWGEQSTRLRVDDEVRRVAEELLHPRSVPLWVRAGMPLARLITAGLLSDDLRIQFALPWSVALQRRYERAMTAVRFANRILPRAIRHWPKNRLLRDLDRELDRRPPQTTVG